MPVRPILVVEDEPDIRSLLVRLLIRHGYAVDSARDGDEAIAKLQSPATYSGLLLDFAMPGSDGAAVIRHLKEIAPAMLPRTVVITAYPDVASANPEVDEIFEVLSKPVTLERLLSVLSRATGGPSPVDLRADGQRIL
jgi:CheY-like chemotaxis protein